MAGDAILIIDDHALFRSGVVAMLSTALIDVPVLGSASLSEALATATVAPTVILLDIQLPGLDGLEGMGLLRDRWPAARIVVVSAQDQSGTIDKALAQGAVAFLSKTDRPERMMAVLRELLEPLSGTAPDGGDVRPSLTPRQIEVLAPTRPSS